MFGVNNWIKQTTLSGFLIAVISMIPAAGFASMLSVRDTVQDQVSSTSNKESTIPKTAAEHRKKVVEYRNKAAEYRREIDVHKKMLADYSKGVARNPKDANENSYIKKFRLPCERDIKAAEDLARENDEMAKYHTWRANELENK